jgi:hypothetical protein
MDLRPTNADEKLPVEPYRPQPSRDRKGANVSPVSWPFFNRALLPQNRLSTLSQKRTKVWLASGRFLSMLVMFAFGGARLANLALVSERT